MGKGKTAEQSVCNNIQTAKIIMTNKANDSSVLFDT